MFFGEAVETVVRGNGGFDELHRPRLDVEALKNGGLVI